MPLWFAFFLWSALQLNGPKRRLPSKALRAARTFSTALSQVENSHFYLDHCVSTLQARLPATSRIQMILIRSNQADRLPSIYPRRAIYLIAVISITSAI
jgi:hypothetical protein